MNIARIKDLTGQGKTVSFSYYEKGNLVYETDCGFEFYVPISDCGDGIFLAEDKASMFRRYIRKQMDLIEEGKSETI
jgi:hypothetical protein